MRKYTIEEIIKQLQEQKDIRCLYYDYDTKKKKTSVFNIIYYNWEIDNEFEIAEPCMAYTKIDNINYNIVPISQIIKIYSPEERKKHIYENEIDY